MTVLVAVFSLSNSTDLHRTILRETLQHVSAITHTCTCTYSTCMYYHIHNYEFYYRYYYCTFQISTIHNFTNSMGQMSLLGQLLHVRRHLSKDIIQLHGIYTNLHVVHYVFILMVSLLIVANLIVFIVANYSITMMCSVTMYRGHL